MKNLVCLGVLPNKMKKDAISALFYSLVVEKYR